MVVLIAVGFGQTSLYTFKNQIATAVNDTQRLKAILAYCSHWDSFSPDTLTLYTRQLQALSEKLKDKQGMLLTGFYQAVCLLQQNKPDTAVVIIDKAFASYKAQQQYNPMYLQFYRIKGNALLRMARYEQVTQLNYDLLKEAEAQKDTMGIALACLGLGNVSNRLQKKEEALAWYYQAMHLLRTDERKAGMSYLFNNMAIVHYKNNAPDSALFYIEKGLYHARISQNLTDYANAWFLKGGLLAEYGKTREAEAAFATGLDIRRQIGDVYYVVTDMAQTALFFLNSGQPKKGIALCLQGLEYQKENGSMAGYSELYQSLARNYKAAGLYKEAAETLEKYAVLKDSIFEHTSAEALAEMQTRYEVQKKESTILKQQFDLARKNWMLFAIAAAMAATILFGYVYLRNRRRTQLLKLQQLEAAQKQKTTEAVRLAEENERKRIAIELHDSVAQKMVVAKMNLETLTSISQPENLTEMPLYSHISQLLEEAATEVRQLSHTLMPQTFAKQGLANAVSEMLEKIVLPGLNISFNAEGNFAHLTNERSLMLFRAIQEAVQNALKHARASQLEVALYGNEEGVDVSIEDDGVGFDAVIALAQGQGLKNVESRIGYLGGTITINSTPGKGTSLVIFVPSQQP